MYDRNEWLGFVLGNPWGVDGKGGTLEFDEMLQLWVVTAI